MQTLCTEFGLRTDPNWSKIQKITMTSQFSDMSSTSSFLDVVLFLLSSLVPCPSFMTMSSLILELWKFSFIRDWPEIRKSEVPPSEFCPTSGDWSKLCIPNLARVSLIECYWMLQISRVTTFTVLELLRENQLRGGVKLSPPTQIRVKLSGLEAVVQNSKKDIHPNYAVKLKKVFIVGIFWAYCDIF